MERIKDSVSGDDKTNWGTNNGVLYFGVTTDGGPVYGTPNWDNSVSLPDIGVSCAPYYTEPTFFEEGGSYKPNLSSSGVSQLGCRFVTQKYTDNPYMYAFLYKGEFGSGQYLGVLYLNQEKDFTAGITIGRDGYVPALGDKLFFLIFRNDFNSGHYSMFEDYAEGIVVDPPNTSFLVRNWLWGN
jgi:hypothetical protein